MGQREEKSRAVTGAKNAPSWRQQARQRHHGDGAICYGARLWQMVGYTGNQPRLLVGSGHGHRGAFLGGHTPAFQHYTQRHTSRPGRQVLLALAPIIGSTQRAPQVEGCRRDGVLPGQAGGKHARVVGAERHRVACRRGGKAPCQVPRQTTPTCRLAPTKQVREDLQHVAAQGGGGFRAGIAAAVGERQQQRGSRL